MPNVTNPSNGPVMGRAIIDGTSYSGADIRVVVHLYNDTSSQLAQIQQIQQSLAVPGLSAANIGALQTQLAALQKAAPPTLKTLAELQTLSVSTYREVYPVRTLSSVNPTGFTFGPRTIAGSMVFAVFDQNVLFDLLQVNQNDLNAVSVVAATMIDQLPPLDITISFANELGQLSTMAIYGVKFVSEGQTMSIQDLFIESTVQWIALDISPMQKVGHIQTQGQVSPPSYSQVFAGSSASQLLSTGPATQFDAENNPFAAAVQRSDPFE